MNLLLRLSHYPNSEAISDVASLESCSDVRFGFIPRKS